MRLIDAEELKRELKIWCYNRTTTTPTFSFVTEKDIDECPTIIKPCEFCKYKRTSICGLCDDFDEFEEIDFVQPHKKLSATLKVERQMGEWIYRREDKYSCSKCGTTTSVDESGIEEKPMYKFCPYCGAKMFEPQESEDKE